MVDEPRADGLGIPDAATPESASQTPVPGRNFGRTGEFPVSTRHDYAAVYAILFGTEDTPSAWLHAGEALSAAWLTAIERGISVLPLGAPVEVETTRLTLRRLLAQRGQPFLVLRFGHADADLSARFLPDGLWKHHQLGGSPVQPLLMDASGPATWASLAGAEG